METLVPPVAGSYRPTEVALSLQHELLALAKQHDDAAATQASGVPYWAPCPAEVAGHRAAAALLRQDAARLERQHRGRWPSGHSGDEDSTGCP